MGETRTPPWPTVVPLRLSDPHKEALRDECLSALHGVLGDLAIPDRLRDPTVTASAGEVYRRLLEALDAGEIRVPDEEMRALLGREFDLYRKAEKVDEVMSRRGAHLAILSVLDCPAAERQDDDEADRSMPSPGPRWLPGDADDCRREVLDLLLSEAPNCLAFSDIAVALAGDPENVRETNALRDAITVLVGAGLARRQGGVLAPTRPARRMADLGFSIG
jgi:hypothetical protein